MLVGCVEKDNSRLVLLGLSRGNVERLTQGKPVLVSRERHGPAMPDGLEVALFFGETEEAILADLRRHGLEVTLARAPDTAAVKETARTLGLGATGEYPHGSLGPDDQGELRAGLTVKEGKLVLVFGKEVSWLALTPEEAREMARLLVVRADEAERSRWGN